MNSFTSLPSREEQLRSLQSNQVYDVLVERYDFASGTSSRSTKLIHGGVRYLENFVKKMDWSQLVLVFEALHERKTFMDNAPNLTHALAIMTPIYRLWEGPYYWIGLKAYDLLSGTKSIYGTKWVSAKETARNFPMIARQGLVGSGVYYDGQMEDARVNLSLALTASQHGAHVANYVEVVNLLKDPTGGRVRGATVRDTASGRTWDINAKVVVNATGAFADAVRHLDDPEAPNMIAPSSGGHVVLPDYYSPNSMGLVVPKTSDGRVLFLLPWEGQTVAGTTDTPTELSATPAATEKEIDFILDTLERFLSVAVRREDVKAAWSGIRPLAKDVKARDTASISRDHVIDVSDNQLVTIAGGKWTTYRRMALEAVDTAIRVGGLKPASPCITDNVRLIGGENWDPAIYTILTQEYKRKKQSMRNPEKKKPLLPITTEIAEHLSHNYGTRAFRVAQLAQDGYGNRLASGYPYLEAEVIFACQEEYARTPIDVLARRTRLAFLDYDATIAALPRVVDLMARQLNWDEDQKADEFVKAVAFVETMSNRPKEISPGSPVTSGPASSGKIQS
eukprot:TRINITY_DN5984_c0_g1_i1.p1 TRINITY_DN5984_c0_g1~~TRINITY_DN5984_c0_g1_i1.p1  ORF type:complete len:564 (-),score=164.47 TRINITY_DN5984_c0_g1_i1:96-1787(-)